MDLDPRLTFESFVVGSSNHLAAAAARRVAEAPGAAYNPLFIYSASGLGKTHLLMAMGNHARRVQPDINVMYDTLEHLMESVMTAIHAGESDAFRARLRGADLLILDDVQFLAGRRGAQDELLRSWDTLWAHGGQIVLACDRPPREIDELDDRLMSRFSGGLTADLGAPEYETRVAIVKRKAEERQQRLAEGVAEALARIAYDNVRELQGALNRVLAVQELESRTVTAAEVGPLLGVAPLPPPPVAAAAAPAEAPRTDDLGAFLSELNEAVAEVIQEPTPEQRLTDAAQRWQGEGFRTTRLENVLLTWPNGTQARAAIAHFEQDVRALAALAEEIRTLDPAARELARLDILRNPDRLQEAEALLVQVRERVRPLPAPPEAPTFRTLQLDPGLFAVRAARAIAESPGGGYNPLFIHGPAGAGKSALLTAIARALVERGEDTVAYVGGEEFREELIRAIERNTVDSWRTRYRRARMFALAGVEALCDTERAQEELFHLFDDLRRAGAQIVMSATVPPRELTGLEHRLQTRLESGLVVELGTTVAPPRGEPAPQQPAPGTPDPWFLERGRASWEWPRPSDWLIEELD
jgi:chromosomal replication initiator protein